MARLSRATGRRPARRLRAVVALAAVTALAGCSSTGSLFGQRSTGDTGRADNEDAGIADAGVLGIYLETIDALIDAGNANRVQRFSEIREAAAASPTATNRLLYAIALSVPGHPGFNPSAAVRRLEALIAAGEMLLPAERMLAEMQLQSAAQLAMLAESDESSEQRLEAALATQDAEHAAALDALRTENERLEMALKEALDMLEAITNIERSISERDDTDE